MEIWTVLSVYREQDRWQRGMPAGCDRPIVSVSWRGTFARAKVPPGSERPPRDNRLVAQGQKYSMGV